MRCLCCNRTYPNDEFNVIVHGELKWTGTARSCRQRAMDAAQRRASKRRLMRKNESQGRWK